MASLRAACLPRRHTKMLHIQSYVESVGNPFFLLCYYNVLKSLKKIAVSMVWYLRIVDAKI
jgi:hypothetical protein